MKKFRRFALKTLARIKIFIERRIFGEAVSPMAVLRDFAERDISNASLIWAMIFLFIEGVLLIGLAAVLVMIAATCF